MIRKLLLLLILSVPSQAIQAEISKLKVGVILPLSGPLADFGIAIKNGIELYQSEHLDSVRKIVYVYEDDQYDAKNSITAYRKLATIDKVDMFFSFGSPACSALAPIVDHDGNLILCFTPDENSARNTRNVYRAHNGSIGFIKPLLNYLRDQGEGDFKVVKTEMGYVNSMLNALQSDLSGQEKLEVVATVNPTETDFRTIILMLKSRKIKTLGLFLLPSQLINFMKQAAEVNYKLNLYSTNLIESALALPKGELLNGAVYSYLEVYEVFIAKYKAKFSLDAQMAIAVNSYDMAEVLDSGFTPTMSKKVPTLAEIFKKVSKKKGSSGVFSYTEDDISGKYFEYAFRMKKVVDGRGVVIK